MLVGIDVIVHEASELLLERLHLVGIREVHGSLPWQILFCAAELILPRPPHQAVPSSAPASPRWRPPRLSYLIFSRAKPSAIARFLVPGLGLGADTGRNRRRIPCKSRQARHRQTST